MAATAVMASGVQAKKKIHLARADADEIMLMLEKTMERVCEWCERIEAQTTGTVKHCVGVWKQRIVNCKDVLRRKVAALTEVEKEQVVLRWLLEGKDAELAKVRAELKEERRAHTEQVDIKSLKR
jgi:molybdenum cofactor biosynthesis enzyme MoaA